MFTFDNFYGKKGDIWHMSFGDLEFNKELNFRNFVLFGVAEPTEIMT